MKLRQLLTLLPLIAACEEDTTTTTNPPVGTPDGGVETPEPRCTAPTSGPTLHKGDIAEGEVWRADASPHIVEYNVTVRSGRTLTIEPCAEVLFAKDTSLQVAFPGTPNSGTLVAQGTAARPIRFAGRDGARWSAVEVQAPGTARLAYVTLENGGSDRFNNNATIKVEGDGLDGADPLVLLDHVTVVGSQGAGIWMTSGATFTGGSRDLTVRGSGGYPLEIEEHALDAVPTGVYTGNTNNEILVDPRGGQYSGTGILADTTIHDRGVPYHVGRSKSASLNIGGRQDGPVVTVTIEPGVEMRFVEDGALKIQHFQNDKPSTAALRAIGTAARPIVFTSVSAGANPGAWRGFWYGGIPDAKNAVEYVRIQNAGASCGCLLLTCSQLVTNNGAVIFGNQPPSAFFKNSKFVDIAGNAFTEGFTGSLVDFRPTNEFTNVANCVQTLPSSATCPSPRPACDGQ